MQAKQLVELGPKHLLQPFEHDSQTNDVRLAKNVSGHSYIQVEVLYKNRFFLQVKQSF